MHLNKKFPLHERKKVILIQKVLEYSLSIKELNWKLLNKQWFGGFCLKELLTWRDEKLFFIILFYKFDNYNGGGGI